MPEFFTVSLLFLRLDDGTKKQLPYTYATAFQPTGNFSIIIKKYIARYNSLLLITYKKNNLLPQIL